MVTFADLSSIVSLPECGLLSDILDNGLSFLVLQENSQFRELAVSKTITQFKEGRGYTQTCTSYYTEVVKIML